MRVRTLAAILVLLFGTSLASGIDCPMYAAAGQPDAESDSHACCEQTMRDAATSCCHAGPSTDPAATMAVKAGLTAPSVSTVSWVAVPAGTSLSSLCRGFAAVPEHGPPPTVLRI